MSIINNTDIENNSIYHYDICIVGSGMSGQIIASEIKNKKVVIVESGSFDKNNKIEKLNEINLSGLQLREYNQNRIRQIGGSANLWANQLMMLNENDFEKRTWIDEKQIYPVNIDQLKTYYLKIIKKVFNNNLENFNNILKVKTADENSVNNEFINKNIFDVNYHFWPSKVEKFNCKSKFTKKLLKLNFLDFLVNFTATKLNINDQSKKLTSIDFLSGDKKINIKANVFILSCGAIENARILLNNIPQNKILDNPNIGKYFMEHPRTTIGIIKKKDNIPLNLFFGKKYYNYSVRQSLAFTKDYIHQNKVLNSYAFIDPKFQEIDESKYNNFLKEIKKLLKERKIPNFKLKELNIKNFCEQMYFNLPQQISKGFLNNIFRLVFQKQNYKFTFSEMKINYQGEQFPNYKSCLKLTNQYDLYRQKKAILNWELSELDYKTIDHFTKLVSNNFKDNKKFIFIENKNKEITDSSHHMGTTRISNDPSDGVVDSNCKFHSLSNLYISGNSIFRTSGSANPGLTNMALSMRLGEYINKLV